MRVRMRESVSGEKSGGKVDASRAFWVGKHVCLYHVARAQACASEYGVGS
jgi:hypothetical protein